MKFRLHYLAIAAVAILIVSCKKSNTQGRYIPANAALAVHINGKSLTEKLPWAEIKNNPLFKDAYADTNLTASLKKLLDNPENSGIDTKGDLQFFIQKDSLGGYVALEGSIKDAAAFKTFCTEMTENGTATEKDGVNYISRFPTCIGWTKEHFVLVADAPEMGQMDDLSRRMMRDSIDISNHRPRDIGATCAAVFALEESKSLAKEERFSKLLNEQGDVHMWINTEEFSKGSASSAKLTMINFDKLIKGSATAITMNFDNGKITANTHSYASEELTKLYKKYSSGKVDEDMLKRIPGKDIVALMAFNFQPEALRDFLKLLNLDGLINIGAAQMGFTLDDFIKANKGDILFALSDLKMVADTTAVNSEYEELAPRMPKPEFNFVFAASVADKDAFNKLIATGKKAGGALLNNGGAFTLAYANNPSYFALANSQENADKFIAGGSNNAELISKISGEPMAFYVNLQSIIKTIGTAGAVKDSSSKIIYDASLKLWDNVTMKGGKFSDGASNSTIEINLLDKSTNSLKQLNQYVFTISEIVREKKRKQKEDMMAFEDAVTPGSLKDSTTAAPAEIKEK
jgi:hypothetical protein